MTSQPPIDGALLTVPEVAATLRVSRALAYRMVAAGDIPSTKFGRSVRVPRAKLRSLDRRPNPLMDALEPVEADRLRELETVIEGGLQTFAHVGAALLKIGTSSSTDRLTGPSRRTSKTAGTSAGAMPIGRWRPPRSSRCCPWATSPPPSVLPASWYRSRTTQRPSVTSGSRPSSTSKSQGRPRQSPTRKCSERRVRRHANDRPTHGFPRSPMRPMSGRMFVPIYRDLMNEYPAIYDDAAALGTYVQMLMDADALWPARPQVPRRVTDEQLGKLTECGLVTLEEHDRYSIKGLDKRRQAQSEMGRDAALRGWAKRKGDGYPNGYPNSRPNAYQTRTEQNRTDHRATAREESSSKKRENGELSSAPRDDRFLRGRGAVSVPAFALRREVSLMGETSTSALAIAADDIEALRVSALRTTRRRPCAPSTPTHAEGAAPRGLSGRGLHHAMARHDPPRQVGGEAVRRGGVPRHTRRDRPEQGHGPRLLWISRTTGGWVER